MMELPLPSGEPVGKVILRYFSYMVIMMLTPDTAATGGHQRCGWLETFFRFANLLLLIPYKFTFVVSSQTSPG